MHRILINKELCTGCKSCVLSCMLGHGSKKDVYSLDLEDLNNDSRNHIEIDKNNKPVPIVCRHCDTPEYVLTCIGGAMKKDKEGYKKFIIKDNGLKGAIIQGDIYYTGVFTHLIKKKIVVNDLENRIFGLLFY